jgi:hypothetical protein
MKELIKQLSQEQKELKKARKTGPYEITRHKYGWVILPENVQAACCAASKVQNNKSRITAALNLYHELRGSSYRHNFDPNDYKYNKAYKELVAVYQKTDGINCSETQK